MKPTEEQLEAYKTMAKESAGADMESQIRENLQKTCDKFPGNEDKLDRCIEYLNDCAREILGNKNGDVPDEVCYRICRDYFNDEIWKQEDEEEARKKAEREKKQAEKEAKQKSKKNTVKVKKKETCTVCKKEFKKLYVNGLCKKCHEEKRREEAEAIAKKIKEEEEKRRLEAAKLAAKGAEQKMKADVCPGQMDFFAVMGV